MIKEIGGYLELDNFINNEYYKNYLRLNSARNCLNLLIEKRNIRKIYIPYYICDSVNPDCEIVRYNIDMNFLPILDEKIVGDNDWVYIVNYYGQISNEQIMHFKKIYKNIIVDNVQAFFQEALDEIDTIYSCRKFFGVPDGAYLSSNIELNEELAYDKSFDGFKHIIGRYENSASEFFKFYKDFEKQIGNKNILYMSKLTNNILNAIDYNSVIKRRNDNFNFLKTSLDQYNLLKIKSINGAYCYPLFVNHGEKLKKYLISNKIYIPTLWPNVFDEVKEESLEYQLVLNIVPIPCDQRYTIEDMDRIIKIVKGEINE